MTDIVERALSLADCDARAGEPLGKCLRECVAEIERLRERERYFAERLNVADGGRYRADWDAPLQRVLDEIERLREALRPFGLLVLAMGEADPDAAIEQLVEADVLWGITDAHWRAVVSALGMSNLDARSVQPAKNASD